MYVCSSYVNVWRRTERLMPRAVDVHPGPERAHKPTMIRMGANLPKVMPKQAPRASFLMMPHFALIFFPRLCFGLWSGCWNLPRRPYRGGLRQEDTTVSVRRLSHRTSRVI